MHDHQSQRETLEKWPFLNKPDRVVLPGSMLLFIWLLARNSWVGDDIFITMRVVDNFVHGYGLVWNVGERVQVFTHPLWLFLITLIYRVFPDPFLTLYWLSYVISLLSIYLILRNFTKSSRSIILASLLLVASMAFVDYSSSGLENPLTNLLLVLMLVFVFKSNISLRTLFFTSLLAALASVNRLDTILFYLPSLVFQLVVLRKSWLKAAGLVLLGFSPLILWELFAIFYFGFPFPNTYYTKFATLSLPSDWLQQEAWGYFQNSLRWDPITLGSIALSLFFVIWERDARKIVVSLGVVFYLFYVYWVGGDFMSGRFFAAPFVVSLVLLLMIDYHMIIGPSGMRTYFVALALVVFLGLVAEHPSIFTKIPDPDPDSNSYNSYYYYFDEFGIANEKLYYFLYNSWGHYLQTNTVHGWAKEGILQRESGQRFVNRGSIGMFGYYAGPQVYILDKYALTDPLRSRLFAVIPSRMGHLERDIPLGYQETLTDHYNNHILDPDLHLYYDKLSVLIHDDLFAPGRVQEIINFNLGRYDSLVARYNYSLKSAERNSGVYLK